MPSSPKVPCKALKMMSQLFIALGRVASRPFTNHFLFFYSFMPTCLYFSFSRLATTLSQENKEPSCPAEGPPINTPIFNFLFAVTAILTDSLPLRGMGARTREPGQE